MDRTRKLAPPRLLSEVQLRLSEFEKFGDTQFYKEKDMAKSREIRNVTIVGTGVIGASWATLYLARGFDVTATDPAPNAEADLRRYVDTAWQPLATLGLSPKASPEHLSFTAD